MSQRLLLGFLLVACSGGPATPAPASGDNTDASPSEETLDLDLATFEAMLAGELDPHTGALAIAARGGWPLATPDGFVFVRLNDEGSPYRLATSIDDYQAQDMQAGPGFDYARLSAADPANTGYKFVNRSDAYSADPLARRYRYDDFGEMSLVRATGAHLQRWLEVGDGVMPRTVRIWVPAETPTRHLYAHDGQNLFDPEAPWGGWRLQAPAGSATLIIGIDNTSERMSEYTHVADQIGDSMMGGDADAYVDFVDGPLRTFIEDHYGPVEVVGVMGSSLGGLVSYHQVLRHPGRYQFAASLSGTFGWGRIGAANPTLIERAAVAEQQEDLVFYLDSGGGSGCASDTAGTCCVDSDADGIRDDSPGKADNFCETRQMAEVLSESGYAFGERLFHFAEPGAPHNEAAWRDRVSLPLSVFEDL